MRNNVIKFEPKRASAEEMISLKGFRPINFIYEEEEFTYMSFGKVSVIQGKDSFAKRLKLVKS